MTQARPKLSRSQLRRRDFPSFNQPRFLLPAEDLLAFVKIEDVIQHAVQSRMSKKQESAEKHDRIVIHFDYDCFYASVIENENPTLKSLPLAIQQKQIVVTCNYEARRRGLYKLQLITEAKRICPEVVIIVGEDLTRFRNASKELYNFLNESTWSHKAERLGFDEVWSVWDARSFLC